jgi:hypothetical protein
VLRILLDECVDGLIWWEIVGWFGESFGIFDGGFNGGFFEVSRNLWR